MTALLVTGSRSLARIPGADEWAAKLIAGALDAIGAGRSANVGLVTGDAPGPDTWALDVAYRFSLMRERWQLNGFKTAACGGVRLRWWRMIAGR